MKNKKDVEIFVEKICKSAGLDFSKLACGYGKKEDSRGRYVFDLGDRKIESKKYAIKYFSEDEIFLVWKLHIKGRRVYSLSKHKTINFYGQRVKSVKKGIEYSNRGTETVYVAKKDELLEVLNQLLDF